jgi:hypothetical protein
MRTAGGHTGPPHRVPRVTAPRSAMSCSLRPIPAKASCTPVRLQPVCRSRLCSRSISGSSGRSAVIRRPALADSSCARLAASPSQSRSRRNAQRLTVVRLHCCLESSRISPQGLTPSHVLPAASSGFEVDEARLDRPVGSSGRSGAAGRRKAFPKRHELFESRLWADVGCGRDWKGAPRPPRGQSFLRKLVKPCRRLVAHLFQLPSDVLVPRKCSSDKSLDPVLGEQALDSPAGRKERSPPCALRRPRPRCSRLGFQYPECGSAARGRSPSRLFRWDSGLGSILFFSTASMPAKFPAAARGRRLFRRKS